MVGVLLVSLKIPTNRGSTILRTPIWLRKIITTKDAHKLPAPSKQIGEEAPGIVCSKDWEGLV